MSEVHICIPILNRYDLLRRLLLSLRDSTVLPTEIHLIDNGNNWAGLAKAMSCTVSPTNGFDVKQPAEPMGLAECWNYWLRQVPEARIICNDDVTFAPESLRYMSTADYPFVSALAGSNAFSCFKVSDECVAAIGEFDESISPGYAYFEDNDYAERLAAAGIPITSVECGVQHVVSATLATYTEAERAEHHRKFNLARANFVRKYGALPSELEARRRGGV